MNNLISWVRNNLITLVEVIGFVLDGIEIIVNGLVRLFPSNSLVIKVHDILKNIDAPVRNLKSFLLKIGG